MSQPLPSVPVTDAQALLHVIQILGPVKVLYRGDEKGAGRFNAQIANRVRAQVNQWRRTLIWFGDRSRRSW